MRFQAGLAACILGLAVPAAAAQLRAEVDLKEITSRTLTRIAGIDLRNNPDPQPQDFETAAVLLGLAQELQPEDTGLLRRRIEAAWAAGDRDLAVRITEDLLRLDPKDTVAQLRLITFRIGQISTIEDRLAAYSRFLDGAGATLDPSVRSRLALDAALLLREQGNNDGFVQRLTEACQLDSTNKEAASLAATYAAPHADQYGRLDLLVNLLMADPLDPNVHASLASEFARGGAFEACNRFLSIEGSLLQASGLPTTSIDTRLKALTWLQQGPKPLVDAINRQRINQMDAVAKQRDYGLRNGVPAAKLPRPEDVRVPIADAVMQILALDASGDRAAVQAALAEMGETVNLMGQNLLEPTKRPLSMSQDQAEAQLVAISVQLQLVRLWTGVQIDDARQALDPRGALTKIAPGAVASLTSWLKMHSGDPAGALEDLRRDAEAGPTARIGAGLALELLGRKDEAAEEYRHVVRAGVLTAPGAWAHSRLQTLGAPEPRDAERLEEYARSRIPAWVDRMPLRPGDYVRLDADLRERSLDATERDRLVLSLTNNAPIPLALGADRPLSSRMLVAPKFEDPGNFMPAMVKPEIVDMDRRLRLMPRETLSVEAWPDPGESGLLLELMAFRTARVRWRVIQGFWISQGGGYQPGPMCLSRETGSLVRSPLPDVTFSIESYTQKFKGDPERLLPRLAVGLRAILLNRALAPVRPGDPAPTDDAVIPVAQAVAERYTALSPECRAMLAAILPHQHLAPSMKVMDDAVRADTDPMVRCIALATRVTTADDDLIAQAAASDDPRQRALAELLKARTGHNGKPYSTWTADFLRRPPEPDVPASAPGGAEAPK